MRNLMRTTLAAGLLLSMAGLLQAQQRLGGGSSGGGSGGSFGGGSSGGGASFGGMGSSSSSFGAGGFGSSSFGSTFGGGSGGTGGLGGTGGFGATSTGGLGATGGGRGGTTSSWTANPVMGKYYGNPLAAGFPQASSTASQYVRQFPVQLSFGIPLYDIATLSRVAASGQTSLGLAGGVGGLGGLGGLGTGIRFAGANTSGIRRAPGYITEPAFDVPPRPSMESIRGDLQGIISRSTRLPSRDQISVTTDGNKVILRGQVRDERERRLAEAVIRMTPGVTEVRNDLRPRNQPAKKGS